MPVDLTKYNTAARICGHVFNYLKMNIQQHSVLNIKTLYNMGMKEIQDRCDMVYKKVERKGVACPISINVNSCVDNFIPDLNDNNQDTFDTFDIKLNDIVKIKLGVDIDGCIAMYCETFIYNRFIEDPEVQIGVPPSVSEVPGSSDSTSDSIIEFLNKMKKEIVKQIYVGNTNDEVKIHIESKCTDNNCFPLINCKSYEHLDNQIYNNDAKYMVLNYKRLYDKDEYLVQDNTCFEFLEDEVYTININVVPESNDDDDNRIEQCKDNYIDVYVDSDNSRLHRLNDCFYSFKLKTSKQFYSTIHKKHNNNAFNISEYTSDVKMKLGMNECKKTNILDVLPLMYTKNKSNVYSCMFTVVVQKENCIMLKYN
jgi:methionine aminopeptidase